MSLPITIMGQKKMLVKRQSKQEMNGIKNVVLKLQLGGSLIALY